MKLSIRIIFSYIFLIYLIKIFSAQTLPPGLQNWVSNAKNQIDENGNRGTQIGTAHDADSMNNGCLDGNCCVQKGSPTDRHLWSSPTCPLTDGEKKWYFTNSYLMAGSRGAARCPRNDTCYGAGPACMDCWDAKEDCNVDMSARCQGNPWQRWKIAVAPTNASSTDDGEPYFSIVSTYFKNRCLTLVTNEYGPLHYKLMNCTYGLKQRFYIPGVTFNSTS